MYLMEYYWFHKDAHLIWLITDFSVGALNIFYTTLKTGYCKEIHFSRGIPAYYCHAHDKNHILEKTVKELHNEEKQLNEIWDCKWENLAKTQGRQQTTNISIRLNNQLLIITLVVILE